MFRYFQALMGVGVFVMLCWTIKILYEEVVGQGAPPAQQLNAFVAFVLAIFAGFGVGSFASHVAHSTFQLLVEQRKDRLLVTCWDALQLLLDEKHLQLEQQTPAIETDDS